MKNAVCAKYFVYHKCICTLYVICTLRVRNCLWNQWDLLSSFPFYFKLSSVGEADSAVRLRPINYGPIACPRVGLKWLLTWTRLPPFIIDRERSLHLITSNIWDWFADIVGLFRDWHDHMLFFYFTFFVCLSSRQKINVFIITIFISSGWVVERVIVWYLWIKKHVNNNYDYFRFLRIA